MVRLELDLALTYEVVAEQGADFIFSIHAARTPHQTVRQERLVMDQTLCPEVFTDPVTGTRLMRLHAEPGRFELRYEAIVDVIQHHADPDTLREVDLRRLPLEVMSYLYPSRYCQSDRLLNFAWREFGGMPRGYARVSAIQRWVQAHVRFASNTSDGATTALDTLIEGVGVCRDFAHLMVALCRALSIPARVATGTDYGADPALGPPDLHAYVEVYLSDRWYLFDASGTCMPMGLMRFGTGRDAADVAFATIFGHVETHPPVVQVKAIEGPGLDVPMHCERAISTASLQRMLGAPVERPRVAALLRPPLDEDSRWPPVTATRPGAGMRARAEPLSAILDAMERT